ncbi:MAG: ABC transporter ATP-binding protein [Oscillospiraceae bacterium]
MSMDSNTNTLQTEGTKEIVLSCSDLKKQYPIRKGLLGKVVGQKHIVDNVSLEMEKGETLAIVGESGCGKTVLLRILLGIEEKTAGKIYFNGKSIDDMSAQEINTMRAKIQMIFQDTLGSLHPRMSIKESLEEPLILNGIKNAKEREKIILSALEQVGLAPMYLERYPHQLSGGQRQRVVIARCLVVTPEIIFADEPISALDVSLQAQVINMLMDLQEEYHLSMLLVAHDLAVVRQIANKIMIMYLGNIVESAPAGEIYKNARHPYTKVLLKAAPSISKGIENGGFDVDLKPGDLPDPAAPPKGCPFCTRCIYADEKCIQEKPVPTMVSEGHMVMCHKFNQM